MYKNIKHHLHPSYEAHKHTIHFLSLPKKKERPHSCPTLKKVYTRSVFFYSGKKSDPSPPLPIPCPSTPAAASQPGPLAAYGESSGVRLRGWRRRGESLDIRAVGRLDGVSVLLCLLVAATMAVATSLFLVSG